MSIKKILLFVLFLVMITVLLFGYYHNFIKTPVVPDTRVSEPVFENYGLDVENSSTPDISKLTGDLYITGKLKSEASDLYAPMSIFKVTVDDEFQPIEKVEYESNITYLDTQTNTAPSSAFVFATELVDADTETYRRGIYVREFESGEMKLIHDTGTDVLRQIDWSDERNILVYAKVSEEDYGKVVATTAWDITIYDMSTQEEKVLTTGHYPSWTENGEGIIFLSETGVEYYDYETGEQAEFTNVDLRILDPVDPISAYVNMTVSGDGKYLIITNPVHNGFALYRIVSLERLELQEIGKVFSPTTEYYWPVFSPNNTFYSLQAIDNPTGDPRSRVNPRIEFRAVEDRELLRSVPLEQFDFMQLFTDDWVAREFIPKTE